MLGWIGVEKPWVGKLFRAMSSKSRSGLASSRSSEILNFCPVSFAQVSRASPSSELLLTAMTLFSKTGITFSKKNSD